MPLSRQDTEAEWEGGRDIEGPLSSLRGLADRSNEDILAIVVGDVHLSDKPPIARSAEPDWYAAMERPLKQIREIQNRPECEIAETFYVGDIFHRWNSSAKLINFAISHLPKGCSIFGQHDLPHHRQSDIKDSAYWTVTHEGGCLEHLPDAIPIPINGRIMATGFGWKHKLAPTIYKGKTLIHLAFVHKYIWQEGTGYKGAPKSNHIHKIIPKLEGYDAAFFGDNHKPFFRLTSRPKIINCGSLMARHKDQREYRPCIHFVHADGTISGERLDTSEDKWLTEEELEKKLSPTIDLHGLMERFKKIGNEPTDFKETLTRIAQSKKVKKSVRTLILAFLEACDE